MLSNTLIVLVLAPLLAINAQSVTDSADSATSTDIPECYNTCVSKTPGCDGNSDIQSFQDTFGACIASECLPGDRSIANELQSSNCEAQRSETTSGFSESATPTDYELVTATDSESDIATESESTTATESGSATATSSGDAAETSNESESESLSATSPTRSNSVGSRTASSASFITTLAGSITPSRAPVVPTVTPTTISRLSSAASSATSAARTSNAATCLAPFGLGTTHAVGAASVVFGLIVGGVMLF